MAMFYIKKGTKFISKEGEPITYGTPKKFTSFRDAWKWLLLEHNKNWEEYKIVRVCEAKERLG